MFVQLFASTILGQGMSYGEHAPFHLHATSFLQPPSRVGVVLLVRVAHSMQKLTN